MNGSFFRRDLTKFFQAFDQRMIARQSLSPSIWMNCISPTITDMTYRHLLAKDKGGSQGGTAARRRLRYSLVALH